MRKICSSSKTSWSASLSFTADGRSTPNGFSTTMRARSARSALSRSAITPGAADGGTLR